MRNFVGVIADDPMVRWFSVVALAAALSACSIPAQNRVPDTESSSGSTEASAEAPTPVPTANESGSVRRSAGEDRRDRGLQLLGRLDLVDRVRPQTYDRDAFGSRWADTDGNGCNQRDDVLLRDAIDGTVRTVRQGRCNHDVIAGSWIDPYTGKSMIFDDLKDPSQAQAIQIDHIVSLSEAWVSGADAWSDDRRRIFANDLRNLLAVDGPTNAAKADDDPAAWKPKKAFQCAYASRWIGVKFRYDLAIDSSEARALEEMLGYC